MRLRIWLLFVVFIIVVSDFNIVIAQNSHHCGQHILTDEWFKNKPVDLQNYYHHAEGIRALTQRNTDKNRGPIKYTIPVVFHILHQEGPENISYEQVLDQMRILNIDYQKKNADTIDVVPQFKDLLADVGFEFKLAEIDPKGNCTNGVVRHYTSLTNWDANNLDNFIFSWPREKYLNIYVVKSINIAATAYSFLPGVPVPPEADVVVTNHDMVGSIGSGTVQNSWVITHEIGHWFGLPHIWGITNAPGVACGDDFVEDTPITKGFTHCNLSNTRICDPTIHENIQNYMDYSPCKVMFTKGQADYMYATIESRINGRDNVVSESNHIATGISGNTLCTTFSDYYTTKSTVCKGDVLRFVNLSQPGDDAYTLKWEFPGGNPEESTDSIVYVTYDFEGQYEAKLTTTSVNGSSSVAKLIKVNDGYNGVVPTKLFNFEDKNLPTELNYYNVENDDIFWDVYEGIGANNTSNCLFLNNIFNTNNQGYTDYFETPFFNLTDINKPIFSFYYAFAKKYNGQLDTFRIEYTLDCGNTWAVLPSVPSASVMANTTGGVKEEAFIPTDTQWKKVTITSLFRSFFKNKPSVKFRFYFKSDSNSNGSNNLYLDEITVIDEEAINTNVNDLSSISIEVYPNPTDNNFVISKGSNNIKFDKVELLSPLGKKIDLSSFEIEEGTESSYVVNTKLPNGIYILNITSDDRSISRKIFII